MYKVLIEVELEKIYHHNGKIRKEIPRINGKINGLVKVYLSTGTLSSVIPYENDIQIGASCRYYPSGTFEKVCCFENGDAGGPNVHCNEDGSIYIRSFFKSGRRHGPYEFYDPTTGDCDFIKNYRFGDKHGLYSESGESDRYFIYDEEVTKDVWEKHLLVQKLAEVEE